MSQFATTKMSSRGQVVIPEDIRLLLGLSNGSQFVVMADKDKDVVILKAIQPPRMSEFSEIVGEIRKQVKIAGLTERDLEEAIREERGKK